ncbi:MAG: hypothetical protein ACRD8U_22710 [Pyrinomonadaceae bacterium]
MRFSWKILLTISAILAAPTLLVLRAQQPPPQAESIDLSNFPILDYANQRQQSASERATRDAKSKKYNSGYAPRIVESTDQIFAVSDWDVGLRALPVTNSSAVIIGEITDAQAHLSEDQTKIYSEFVVRLEGVFKKDKNPLNVGDSITVERVGGRVRFPSGKLAVSMVNHQDMPRVGVRYVLFLTHNFPMGGEYDNDYFILTGYELRGGRVFPLDKPLPGHPITAYKGTDEKFFISDLTFLLESNPLTMKSN